LKCYRLTLPAYASRALSGEGAKRAGQRWNSKGTAIAYTAGTPEGCLLEAMIHVHDDGFPVGWRMLEFELPDDAVETLNRLPDGWDELPYRDNVQAVGDKWVAEQRSLVLSVPSAITKTSRNYLVNPAHRAFGRIRQRDVTEEIDLPRIADRLGRA
jgi:RES domain-containing protein